MPFQIKSPITTPPTKRKHRSNQEWEIYKPLMTELRREGKTAEQIRIALQRRGFEANLEAVKRYLAVWEPKHSSCRRRRRRKSIRRNSAAIALEEPRGEPISGSASEVVARDDAAIMALESSHGLETYEEQGGNLAPMVANTLGPFSVEACRPHNASAHGVEASDIASMHDADPLADLAKQILETLNLEVSDADLGYDLPSFEMWDAERHDPKDQTTTASSGNDESQTRYNFSDLLRIAVEMGEPEPPSPLGSNIPGGAPRGSVESDMTETREKEASEDQGGLGGVQQCMKDFDPGEVDNLLQTSATSFEKGEFMRSFLSGRDAFEITKRNSECSGNFEFGCALYLMGWALIEMGKRYAVAIRMFQVAILYFRKGRMFDCELSTMVSLGRALEGWPASEGEIKRNYEHLLERLMSIPQENVGVKSGRDILWGLKVDTLTGLASRFPPEPAYRLKKQLVKSAMRRRGLYHRSTAVATYSLADTLHDLEKYHEALVSMRVVYSIYEALLGPLDPSTINAAKVIRYYLVKTERFDDALVAHRSISRLRSTSKMFPWAADNIVSIGRMLSGLGYFYEALVLFQRGIAELRHQRTERYGGILQTEEWIAEAMYRRGLVLYANPVALHYMDSCERLFGKHDPRSLKAIIFCLRWGLGPFFENLNQNL